MEGGGNPVSDAARRAGLRPDAAVTLDAVERRRWHLMAVMFVVMSSLALMVAVLLLSGGDAARALVRLPALQVAAPLLTAGLALYVVEKERQLGQLSQLLLEDHAVITALARQARRDPLTSLLNRTAFIEALESVIDEHRAGDVTALLFLDLDGFKAVNDTRGHAAGDELLVEVADRFGACLRRHDMLARLAGDEFTALLPGLGSEAEAYDVADRLTASLHGLPVTASVGVAFAGPASTPSKLLREADVAMYLAKEAGRDCWRQFGDVPATG